MSCALQGAIPCAYDALLAEKDSGSVTYVERHRVLVIEDDDDLRKLLHRVLTAARFDVLEARNGAEGLLVYQSEHIDVVLTDLFMPRMDGIEVVQQFRRINPQAKIIVMSSGGQHRIQSLLGVTKFLGATAVIEKPFHLNEVVLAVRRALSDDVSTVDEPDSS